MRSSGCCDEVVEDFGWGAVSEGFAWPVVELVGDGVEVCFAEE
jgi:hypothetical protein